MPDGPLQYLGPNFKIRSRFTFGLSTLFQARTIVPDFPFVLYGIARPIPSRQDPWVRLRDFDDEVVGTIKNEVDSTEHH